MVHKEFLFEQVKKIVEEKYKNVNYLELNNGFQFSVNNFPYIFKIIHYSPIGWNVYLEFINEEALVEHPPTDELYVKIENLIDEINFQYYGLDENIKLVIDRNFDILENKLKIYSDKISNIEKKDLKYIIEFNNVENVTPTMEIKYSISMNRWVMDIKNFFKGNNIHDELFETYNSVGLLVQDFNKQIDDLNFYF